MKQNRKEQQQNIAMDNKKKTDKSEDPTQTTPSSYYSRNRHPEPPPAGLSDKLLPGLQPRKRKNRGSLIVKGGKRNRKDKKK